MAIKRKKKPETKIADQRQPTREKPNRIRQWCLGTILGLLVMAVIGNHISAVIPNPFQMLSKRFLSKTSVSDAANQVKRNPIISSPIERVECKNPPVTATLNYYPVTYSSPAEFCSDYPAIDARLVNGGHYSLSQEEWEAGRTAHDGDEIYALTWISNGAADNAEEIVENRSVARDVKLLTATDTQPGSVHYIYVSFAGEQTNTVSSRFKILTDEDERLEVVPGSGEIYEYRAKDKLMGDLEIGNSTISIGDLKPRFEDGRFVRFCIRVVKS